MGRLCLSQLLDYHDRIISLVEKGLNNGSVYLDFSKDLDKIDHRTVLHMKGRLAMDGLVPICKISAGQWRSLRTVSGYLWRFTRVSHRYPSVPNPSQWHWQQYCLKLLVFICGWHELIQRCNRCDWCKCTGKGSGNCVPMGRRKQHVVQ